MSLAKAVLSYRNHPKLKKFIKTDAKRTGRRLGSGSFGYVEELVEGGTYYAGKMLHDSLLNTHDDGKSHLLDRFVSECELMSELRHPNIIQFMGLCFFEEKVYPVLMMEKLDTSLDDLLEKKGNISLAPKLQILHDITKGLVYLHERKHPIIHRDLTARNVLLDTASMQAKIADLGNALMVNPAKLTNTLSQAPGTLVYMPPEAILVKPEYDASLDMFSFGQLALYTIIQVFPADLLPITFQDPDTEDLKARSEVERRREYFDKLYNIQAEQRISVILSNVIKECLSNKASQRYFIISVT